MKHFLQIILSTLTLAVSAQTVTQTAKLKTFSDYLKIEQEESYKKALLLAKEKNWPLVQVLPNGGIMRLTGLMPNGEPEFTSTESNAVAAASTGASQLWTGGSSGLNLTGSTPAMAGKLAIWDGGAVLGSHQEFTGRILGGDAAASISDHATHVAGTMVAKGVNAQAKGMAYDVANITAYDFTNDNAEMASGAPNFLISNHSYGAIAGWRFNSGTWEWYGEWGATEDFKFGYYDSRARYWDSIAVLSPNYLIVKSAGNKRNENGPAIGASYRRRDASGTFITIGSYDGSLSPNNSFDILPTYSTAKNLLTVAAVNKMPNGYTNSSGVQQSDFTSWGPTDDGRIKPDISAAGVDILSTIGSGTTAYDTYSGTSMSSPNASGSLFLIQELWYKETTTFMRSATLKALAIHTAGESGTAPGPDYVYGWGMLNVDAAAKLVKSRTTTSSIQQNTLAQGATFTQNVVASGTGPLVATIVWTDPAAAVETVNYLNNRTPKLVNDLDIRVTSASGMEMPWRLDVNNPAAPATKGDNILDNVEKIEIPNAIAGQQYTITVTHKGNLVNGSQAYSLILSGVGGTLYCTSQPNSNANSKINIFNYAGINRNAAAGCTQYTNALNLIGTSYPGQTQAFSVTLGTCGTDQNKMAKIFIDWNGDGDFADAGETSATSAVLAGTGVFAGNITTPSTVTIGNSTRIRVVASETTDPTTITPCGNYGFGETLDLSLRFVNAAFDATVSNVFLPENGICATDQTHLAATIKNNGTSPLITIPVRAHILDGNTTVAILHDTLKNGLLANSFGQLYFRNTFVSQPGKTYTIRVNTQVPTEQVMANDTLSTTKTIAAASTATLSNIKAQACSPTQVIINSNLPANNTVYWYTTATGGTPIANGNNTTISSGVPANYTFYAGINDAKANVGPVNKNALGTAGGYVLFNNVQNLIVNSPILIESSRMYFGNAGTVTVQLKDLSGNVVAERSFDVQATSSTPGQATNDLNDTGRIMPLNFKVNIPGSYTLGINGSGGVTVFRNNPVNVNPYPYVASQLMEITNSNGTGGGTSSYYWFYDIKVSALNCASTAVRQQVVAAQPLNPTITQSGNDLSSSVTGTSYQWLRDNVAISGATNQTHTLTTSGSYTVIVYKDGCSYTSPAFNAVFSSITNINPSTVGLSISPNPSTTEAIIKFTTQKRESVTLDLIDINGRKLQSNSFVTMPNTPNTKVMDVKSYAAGTYLVRLYFDGKQVIKKLVIE